MKVNKEDLLSVLSDTLSDKKRDKEDTDNRWNTKINAIFLSMAKMVSRYFVSRVKGDDVTQIQLYIRHFFRRTNVLEKIRKDSGLQDVFLVGYCHAVDRIINEYEDAVSYCENDSLTGVIASYKHVKDVLLILDEKFEIRHQELAEKLGISKSSLSNFMRKVQVYHLFNSAYIGKNRYYSLAHPNGELALRIVKEQSKPSADGYTDFVLLLLKSLSEVGETCELDKTYVLEKCRKYIFPYITKPATYEKSVAEVVSKLHKEKFFVSVPLNIHVIRDHEKQIKSNVKIITEDIRSEQFFNEDILENLLNNRTYNYYFTLTGELDTEKKVKEFFYQQFCEADYSIEFINSNLMQNIHFNLVSLDMLNLLLRGNTDIVIYDEEKAYKSNDNLISDDLKYFEMQQKEMESVLTAIEYIGRGIIPISNM
ncbi:MAG: hypothetical protein HFG37_05695 [Eubacterium sp.]|nr:hypothetical protein [Eubacterium sp.]